MLNPIQDIIVAIQKALENYSINTELNIQVQLANQQKLGQFQSNIAMLLAKPLQKSPLEIANELVEVLNQNDLFAEVVASKPGFLNFSLKKAYFNDQLNQLLRDPRLGIP